MKITFAESARADIAAFILDEGDGLPAGAGALDKASGGLLSQALEGGRFDGKTGQQVMIVLPKGAEARRAADGKRITEADLPTRALPRLLDAACGLLSPVL